MSPLTLAGDVLETFHLDVPPETAFCYFARNEALLRQFLGHDRVSPIGPGIYRVRLNPHGAMGLSLSPEFDVQFIEHLPDRVEMRSLAARLIEASHGGVGFDAGFSGEARFTPEGGGTRVDCWARTEIALRLPPVLAWLPEVPLVLAGNGIIQTAMRLLASRLGPLMQKDVSRWRAAGEGTLDQAV